MRLSHIALLLHVVAAIGCSSSRELIETEAGVAADYDEGKAVEFFADDTNLRKLLEMVAGYADVAVNTSGAPGAVPVSLSVKGLRAIQTLDIACMMYDHLLHRRGSEWVVEPLPHPLDVSARREIARALWRRTPITRRARSLALALAYASAPPHEGTPEELDRLRGSLEKEK